jgi:hypothetical protein
VSLKSFHIFFIVVATITTFGFALWSLSAYMTSSKVGDLTWGVISLVACGLLIWYGMRFFKKLKKLGPIPRD